MSVKYLLDCPKKIAEYNCWKDYVVGVTTNPSVDPKFTWINLRPEVQKDSKNLFIQVYQMDEFEEKVKDVSFLTDYLVWKVPLTILGYDLIGRIRNYRIAKHDNICGTMCYDLIQLHMAMDLGCEYCIVLVAKNSNCHFLEEAMEFKTKTCYETELIAASFRTKNDVIRAISTGIGYVTVRTELMHTIFRNQDTIVELEAHYGEGNL